MSNDFWFSFLIGLGLGGALIQLFLHGPKAPPKPREPMSIFDTEKW